jgi:RHS repeat-associated protein
MTLRRILIACAMICVSGEAVPAKNVTYFYTSPDGSVLESTNSSGDILSRRDYSGFGKDMLDAAVEGPGFTSHLQDVDSGLVYMQARYYDPSIARFISIDPSGPGTGDLAGFNRFAYVGNNPFSFIDPSGAQFCGVYKCEIYNSGWNDSSVTSKGEANYRVNNSFKHEVGLDPANPRTNIRTPLPVATRDALIKIVMSPFGGRLTSKLMGSGQKIDLVFVDAASAFATFGNEVWYNTNVASWAYSHAESLITGDGVDTATLDVLLVHEFGHTDAGHSAMSVGDIAGDRAGHKEERRAVRMFENPYRAYRGMKPRCSYFTPGDICK